MHDISGCDPVVGSSGTNNLPVWRHSARDFIALYSACLELRCFMW